MTFEEPLTLTLSPEYRGEGTGTEYGASPLSSTCRETIGSGFG
jgi:hypothetical protein